MAKKEKKNNSNEKKTELAKVISNQGKNITKTYENIEIKVVKFCRWCNGWLDRIIFSKKHGKLIALILAVLFFFSMNSLDSGLFENIKSVETLGDYHVHAIVSDQAYEVSGLPETVKVRYIGEIADIKNAKQQKGFEVVADLTNLTEGIHEVNLKPQSAPSGVEVVIEPSNALVTIKKKSIRSFSLGYDFVNRSGMDPTYDLGEPSFQEGEVYVRASKDTLDSIAFVKALIDVKSGYTSDFTTSAPIVAYNNEGDRLDVDIIPENVSVSVKVSKPCKEVPIIIKSQGEIPNNKAIASYKLNHPKVKIYAKQSVLDTITSIVVSIPGTTLTSDKSITMPLIAPNGVTSISESFVDIKIQLDDVEERVIKGVDIELRNAQEGYMGVCKDKNKVDVTIKGAKKVIDKIEAKDLKVYADLSKNDQEGTYELPLIVEGENKLVSYVVKDENVTVQIKGAK